jgi:AraC-like DNA-binding protein
MQVGQPNEMPIFQLHNVAFLSFNINSHYSDIISPFTRLYLITEGIGYVIIGDQKTLLEAGNLYLIPSFTSCTYHFEAGLSHYYIHLNIEHPNGLFPFNMYSYTNKTIASELDYLLFKRILQINPGLQLPHHHPNVYQTKLWLNKKVNYQSDSLHFETVGILEQIFSRFIKTRINHSMTILLKYNIQPILQYIQDNLKHVINVEELANIACFSKDHFSRVFKSVTGMSPCDYIIRKRIERAQFLLLSTDLELNEIMEQTGFNSASYFSRIFKKLTSYSPAKYRLQRS